MKFLRHLILAFTLLIPLTVAAAPARSTPTNQLAFHDAMRKLWEDHVTWTRLFIVSDVQNLPDLGATTDRLLQNQVDIGNAIKPYYGDQAGAQLTDLLTQHILIAAAIVDALKANDAATAQQQLDAWYANAQAIATLLSTLNPKNWPLASMQTMMDQHLALTTSEVQDYIAANYAASVSDYEAVHLEILAMADMLSAGIIAQYPQAFAPGHQ